MFYRETSLARIFQGLGCDTAFKRHCIDTGLSISREDTQMRELGIYNYVYNIERGGLFYVF